MDRHDNHPSLSQSDAEKVGQLIAGIYGEYNLSLASPAEKNKLLDLFQYARPPEAEGSLH
jgi:hypothetical protein